MSSRRRQMSKPPAITCRAVFGKRCPGCAGKVRELAYDDLSRLVPKLAKMSPKKRARLPGVSRHRAHQLLAGAIVAHTAMRLLEVPRIRLCPWGLREGIILRRLDASSAAVAVESHPAFRRDGARAADGEQPPLRQPAIPAAS